MSRIDLRIILDAPDCPGLTHEERAILALRHCDVNVRGIMALLRLSAYHYAKILRSANAKVAQQSDHLTGTTP